MDCPLEVSGCQDFEETHTGLDFLGPYSTSRGLRKEPRTAWLRLKCSLGWKRYSRDFCIERTALPASILFTHLLSWHPGACSEALRVSKTKDGGMDRASCSHQAALRVILT